MPSKILSIAVSSPELCASLCKSLKISPLTAQLLVNRGIKTLSQAEDFLNPRLDSLHDPFSFREMSLAVNVVKNAARQKHKVLIYSDYDVDGVTSIAVLKRALGSMGISASHYIPHRIKEGYGLNAGILELVKQQGVKLVITADCGTNSTGIIAQLRSSGVEVIVTDHHEVSFSGDHPASALINAKSTGESYPYRDLAGVGAAFKLSQAVTGEALSQELDIVSLGTIADSVPLTGENRIFAKEGMARIATTTRPGLRSLMDVGGLNGREINAECVSFILAPRINASGRMDTAERSVQLLMCEDGARAEELAKELESFNRQRQKTEAKMLEEARAIIDREVNVKDHTVIVVAKAGWHAGCLGIVASKIADKFYRPAIVITLDESGKCRGSGRSVGGFHLFAGLSHCQSLLDNFGGHQHAVGMSILEENIAEFRAKLNRFAFEKLALQESIPSLHVDMEIPLSALTPECIAEFERLDPFGEGNPQPLFYSRDLFVKGQSRVLGRQALKFWVTDGSCAYPAIGFGMGSLKESLDSSAGLAMAYRPKIDRWQGQESVILEVKEISLK
jgi:single-stranded-DNA-specific exonuclease